MSNPGGDMEIVKPHRDLLCELEVPLYRSETEMNVRSSKTLIFAEGVEIPFDGICTTVIPSVDNGLACIAHMPFEQYFQQETKHGTLLIGKKNGPYSLSKKFLLYLPDRWGGKMTIECSDKNAKLTVTHPKGAKRVGNKYEEEFWEDRHGNWNIAVESEAENYTVTVTFVQESVKAKNPESDKVPWTGNWWPTFEGSNWNPWIRNGPFDQLDKVIKALFGYEKFKSDLWRGEKNFREWAEEVMKQNTDRSEGHCHIWSYMSAYRREPDSSINRLGVEFTPGDLKGLLTVGSSRDGEWFKTYGEYVDKDKLGRRFGEDGVQEPDPKCDTFHTRLRELWIVNAEGKRITKIDEPILFDADPEAPGWNYPLYKVRYEFKQQVGRDLKTVDVRCTLTHTNYENREYDRCGENEGSKSYDYTLVYKGGGVVDVGNAGNRWADDDTHPDYFWKRKMNDENPDFNVFYEAGQYQDVRNAIDYSLIVECLFDKDKSFVIGKVVDAKTNRPIERFTVRIRRKGEKKFRFPYSSYQKGKFVIIDADKKVIEIEVKAEGYKVQRKSVTVTPPQDAEVEFKLEPRKK